MTSTFSWLDVDDEQRRKMLAVVELFKEDGTVDELGVGSIRDTIADVLFPGTSVLHSRARYLLFIPWLLDQAARSGPSDMAAARFRALEYRLIHALIAGQGTEGVIGARAKDSLKRMPSAAYWAALGRYGIRTPDTTIEGYFRQDAQRRATRDRQLEPDDPGAMDFGRGLLDAHLPSERTMFPTTTFELDAEEQTFLRHRIQMCEGGSLLAWLLARGGRSNAVWVWEHEAAREFPGNLAEVVDAGRRFGAAIHGAALTYNRMLAELLERDDLRKEYDDAIKKWADELAQARPFAGGWSASALWLTVDRQRSVRLPTKTFVSAWLSAVEDQGAEACRDCRVQAMIRQREIDLKGGRARMVNHGALEAWTGGSGLVRLDYRWTVARRLINDIVGEAAA